MRYLTIKELADHIADDPKFAGRVKGNPYEVLMELSERSMEPFIKSDLWIYRTVVIIPGIVLLSVVSDAIYFHHSAADLQQKFSEVLISLGSSALGALAGLLAPSPVKRSLYSKTQYVVCALH